jgi:transcriptional regulator with XRE-family HTH domain
MTFGSILRRFRAHTHLSQKHTSEQIGVAQSTYCEWEADKRWPTIDCLPKFALAFNCTIIDLLKLIFEPALLGTSAPPNTVPTADHRDKTIEMQGKLLIAYEAEIAALKKRLGE